MRNITIGQYYPADSFIHHLDPRVKLLGTLAYIVTLFFVVQPTLFIIPLVAILLLYHLSKVPVRYIFKGLSPFIVLLVFTFIFRGFFTDGTPLFSLGPVTLTEQGLGKAIQLIARIVLMIMCVSLLTYTTTPNNLAQGLVKLCAWLEKFHLPVQDMAIMVEITFRFIPIMIEETNVIIDVQVARGVDFHCKSIWKRMKNMVMIVIPLFMNSLRRSDELAMAMETRGFRDANQRTHLYTLSYDKADHLTYWGILIYTVLFLFVIFYLRLK